MLGIRWESTDFTISENQLFFSLCKKNKLNRVIDSDTEFGFNRIARLHVKFVGVIDRSEVFPWQGSWRTDQHSWNLKFSFIFEVLIRESDLLWSNNVQCKIMLV